ncbi:MAG: hypothetical protein F4222_06285 [Gammaproteobacteria bacterium]|nr:hypothetical protein [Gammaproteobacteria bacterium]MYF58655.1 hypothetical protein [Gammaproteobacteria bacterium]
MNGNRRVVHAKRADAPGTDGDEARKRAIARALWTEIHWLMPTDRAVAIAVDGDDIAVEFGPPGCAPQMSAEKPPISTDVDRRRP